MSLSLTSSFSFPTLVVFSNFLSFVKYSRKIVISYTQCNQVSQPDHRRDVLNLVITQIQPNQFSQPDHRRDVLNLVIIQIQFGQFSQPTKGEMS